MAHDATVPVISYDKFKTRILPPVSGSAHVDAVYNALFIERVWTSNRWTDMKTDADAEACESEYFSPFKTIHDKITEKSCARKIWKIIQNTFVATA